MVTLLQCVKAHKALTAISEQPMPFKTAHALMIAKKSLLPHVEFFAGNEYKLIEEYASHDEGGVKISQDGKFTIPKENYILYANKIQELSETKIDFTPVAVPGVNALKISVSDIENLEGVIEFADD